MSAAASPARFALVVFDWDGTLADSEARIVRSIETAIRTLGLPAPACPPREIIGLGMPEAVAQLFPRHGREVYERFVAAYRTQFANAARAPVELFPGARETLVGLRGRGHLIGVATGKSRRGLDRELAESELAAHVDASRCADEAPSKPDPTMLVEIMDELGVAPAATLVVGDTEYDLAMARAAGAARVGVRSGVHPPERLLESAPLAILDTVADLPAFLGPPVGV